MHCIQADDTQMATGVFEKEDRSFPPGQVGEKALCDDSIRLIARKWILAAGIGQFTERQPSPDGLSAEFIAHAAGFIIGAASNGMADVMATRRSSEKNYKHVQGYGPGNAMSSRHKVRIGGR
jgi:hypothetical protein